MTGPHSPDWYPVFFVEFLVISIINVITIIVFARIRHLRKRSTYLIINLTVVDLLVGAVTGPLFVHHKDEKSNGFTLARIILWAIEIKFPIASQVNLSLISLERLHATLFPFRHCVITKWLYFKITVGSWVIAIVMTILSQDKFPYAWASFNVLNLIIITVSYIIITYCECSRQSSCTTSRFHSQRKETIINIIHSHWSFRSHHFALGCFQFHANRSKERIVLCVEGSHP